MEWVSRDKDKVAYMVLSSYYNSGWKSISNIMIFIIFAIQRKRILKSKTIRVENSIENEVCLVYSYILYAYYFKTLLKLYCGNWINLLQLKVHI